MILKVPSEDEQSEFTRRYSQDLRKRRKNLRGDGDDDEAEDEGEKERRNRDSNSRSSTRRQVQFFLIRLGIHTSLLTYHFMSDQFCGFYF